LRSKHEKQGIRRMWKLTKGLWLVLALAVLLGGCNGGGDGGFSTPLDTGGGDDVSGGGDITNPGGVGPTTAASVWLLVSSPQIASAGTETVTLTALVKNANNVLMSGVDVDFAADNGGTIQITRGTTDETGTAAAQLSTLGNKSNRVIALTASAGTHSDSNSVAVIGTSIQIGGPSTLVTGSSADLIVTVRDSAGTPIPNVNLEASANNSTLSAATAVTDFSGQVTLRVTGAQAGPDTITITGAGATHTHAINVSGASFSYTTPPHGAEVVLGDLQTLTVRWEELGSPVDGQPVRFSTTRGTLSQSTALTNADGEASVTISADNAGPAVITAIANNGPSAQMEILFIATTAASLTLQATPALIGTNSAGNSSQQSEISAVVRDASNNLVKNKTVDFQLTDVSGGRLTVGSAVTDAYGRASTTYIAGQSPSAMNGVLISAVVTDAPAVDGSVTLTVAQQSTFVTLGTGNLIVKDGALRYRQPYGVLVTDAAGGPVGGADVSLNVWPTNYYKGYYIKPNAWEQVLTAGPCPNEDFNRNGLLDPDEDYNYNGQLDPGGGVVLSAPSVTTDASGFADFYVDYFQNLGNWLDVELTARTLVSGSEAQDMVYFTLPVAAADVHPSSATPPGNPSPFGTSSSCSGTLLLTASPDQLLLRPGTETVELMLTQSGAAIEGVHVTAEVVYSTGAFGFTVSAAGGTTAADGRASSTVTIAGGGLYSGTAIIYYRALDALSAVVVQP
jgi:hypothetical protein